MHTLCRQLDKLRLFLVAFNIIHVYNILGMLYQSCLNLMYFVHVLCWKIKLLLLHYSSHWIHVMHLPIFLRIALLALTYGSFAQAQWYVVTMGDNEKQKHPGYLSPIFIYGWIRFQPMRKEMMHGFITTTVLSVPFRRRYMYNANIYIRFPLVYIF